MNHLPLIRSSVLAAFVSAAFGAAAEPAPGPAAQKTLWQIGQSDANDGEFALAPDRYEAFEEDGLFIVGRSDAKTAWPYVHPGPDDAWAGQCEHAFVVLFGVKQPAADGNCRLLVDLLDTHKFKPVTLHLEINGRKFEQKLPAGAGNDSIAGQPRQRPAVPFHDRVPGRVAQGRR